MRRERMESGVMVCPSEPSATEQQRRGRTGDSQRWRLKVDPLSTHGIPTAGLERWTSQSRDCREKSAWCKRRAPSKAQSQFKVSTPFA